jgi:hypothetical protein
MVRFLGEQLHIVATTNLIGVIRWIEKAKGAQWPFLGRRFVPAAEQQADKHTPPATTTTE